MPRFVCENADCENKGKEIVVAKVVYKFNNKTNKMESDPTMICEKCGEPMKDIPKEGFPVVGKFGSMNDADKKKVISQRASAHFDKIGKHEKAFRKAEAIKKMMK